MNKNTYTGSKLQNHFTAYLLEFIKADGMRFWTGRLKGQIQKNCWKI